MTILPRRGLVRILERVLQGGLQVIGEARRDREQRRARVDHRAAAAVLAIVDDSVADFQPTDAHLPVPVVRHNHWRPCQIGAPDDFRGVVATERNLADLVVAFAKEDAEARFFQGLLRSQHAEEAELGRQREAVQTKAENTIERERIEGLVRHVRRRDDPQVHASRRWFAATVGGHNLPARCVAEAKPVADELARDLTGAEGHRDLIPRASRLHSGTIVINVHSIGGESTVKTPMGAASLLVAVARGDDGMPGAGVKNHGELLGSRRPYGDRAEVDALVGQSAGVAPHRYALSM
mmetsp:Transcript_5453/g.11039  ORF Transcript_5453/g.11039 Transcript_5453/m.11039 type:complete len:294 (-) Transcript_5453:36-917(-)